MTSSNSWSSQDIPNLHGKVALITGGNKGLGYQSALALVQKKALVIIACRNLESGLAARSRILREAPHALVEVLELDLTDRKSITDCSKKVKKDHQRLDILLCNAGVVNLENYTLTTDLREMHMATNHLGHFALTAQLLPLIKATHNARVVVVSSLAYKSGVIDFDDLSWKKRKYHRVKSYGDSKLANLLFVAQLNRYFLNQNIAAMAVSAHPGLTGTDRQQSIGVGGRFAKWLASPVEKGVLPQLLAATKPDIKAGDFYGPKFGLKGRPTKLKLKEFDTQLFERLWTVSEELTGTKFGGEF